MSVPFRFPSKEPCSNKRDVVQNTFKMGSSCSTTSGDRCRRLVGTSEGEEEISNAKAATRQAAKGRKPIRKSASAKKPANSKEASDKPSMTRKAAKRSSRGGINPEVEIVGGEHFSAAAWSATRPSRNKNVQSACSRKADVGGI